MTFVTGVIAGLFAASLIANLIQYRVSRRSVAAAMQHETRLLDRARAAEIRAGEQIDAMLARVGTTPRIELGPAFPAAPLSEGKTYFADHPGDDAAWNEFRGDDEDEDA